MHGTVTHRSELTFSFRGTKLSKTQSAKVNVYVKINAVKTGRETRNELECEQNYFNFLSCSFVIDKIVIIIALARSILR